MANPYFVQPPQYGPAMQGLAESLDRFGQQRRADEEQARLQKRFQDAQAAMINAMQSNDPQQVMQAVVEFPELRQTACISRYS